MAWKSRYLKSIKNRAGIKEELFLLERRILNQERSLWVTVIVIDKDAIKKALF